MDFNTFSIELNKKSNAKFPLPYDYTREVEEVNAVQIHTKGARPSFTLNGRTYKPESYEKRFEDLFKTRILNRHPNENEVHYNWRLSVYSPVAKELFDKFYNLCNGSILQPNNYSLSADDKTMLYISENSIDHELSEMLKFILENPKGYFAVINEKEVSENEKAKPTIKSIPLTDIIMYSEYSVAFKINDSIIFLDAENQYTIKKGYETIVYPHNLGQKPFWKQENSFLQPYQFWSEKLGMNMNDDDAVTKHYSYPIMQVVESQCNVCMGSREVVDINADFSNPNINPKVSCPNCHGKGTMTLNVGDAYVMNEDTIAKIGGSMPDMAKFITPDVAIPEYHLKRWQVFYNRVEHSLYLAVINDNTQSGTAKQEDRKDQYFFLQSVSNFLFENFRRGIEYISGYLNLVGNRGQIQTIFLTAPKQFDLMSDSYLVNEFALLQGKTDDSQTLGELNFVVNNKIFRDDKVQKKINEILYYTDVLFGISGNALRSKLLSGIYDVRDKTIHEKGYKVLVRLANELTTDKFLQLSNKEIETKFNERIDSMIPQTISM